MKMIASTGTADTCSIFGLNTMACLLIVITSLLMVVACGCVQLPRATKDRSTRRRLRAYGLNAEDIEAPADGVFRAVPAAGLSDQPSAVSAVRDARWVASLNLAGELYQAFFDNEDDALEAFNAAGFEQPVAAAT